MAIDVDFVDGGRIVRVGADDSGLVVFTERPAPHVDDLDSVLIRTPDGARKLAVWLLMWSMSGPTGLAEVLASVEKYLVFHALRVSTTKFEAARRLGVSRASLMGKLRRWASRGEVDKALLENVDSKNGAEDKGQKG